MRQEEERKLRIRSRKQDLRRIVRERRRHCSEADLAGMSRQITERILALEEYRNAGVVFAYMDLPGEVQTRELIRSCLKDGKKVAIPKVWSGNEPKMKFYEITGFDHLIPGMMQIPEPDPRCCPCLDEEEKALVIMPGVAFDLDLNRIGYGAGFYDRYLHKHTEHVTAAVAFDFQIFDEVPCEETDVRTQILVTPGGVMRHGSSPT